MCEYVVDYDIDWDLMRTLQAEIDMRPALAYMRNLSLMHMRLELNRILNLDEQGGITRPEACARFIAEIERQIPLDPNHHWCT